MRGVAGCLLLASLFSVWPQPAQAADQCVACHTDAAKLQALVRPPAEIAEEEGAG